jgi:hypothetical protein
VFCLAAAGGLLLWQCTGHLNTIQRHMMQKQNMVQVGCMGWYALLLCNVHRCIEL